MKHLLKRTAAAVMAAAAMSGAAVPVYFASVPSAVTAITAEAASVYLDEATGTLHLGGAVTLSAVSTYAGNRSVKSIKADAGTVLPADCTEMFSAFDQSDYKVKYWMNLESVDLSGAEADSVTSMRKMFYCCPKLKSVNFRDLNTGKLTDISSIFDNCVALTEADFSGFEFRSLTNTSAAFAECRKLTTIYASEDWTPTVMGINSDDMFLNCVSLKGRNGRAYNQYLTGFSMARIDGHNSLSGYFSTRPCTSFDEATGTLTLFSYVYEHDVEEYVRDERVKKVVAESGTVLPENCNNLFTNFRAELIDLHNADTSKVKDCPICSTSARE